MGILNLAITCKTDKNSVFISGIFLRLECNVRNIRFIDNKHKSPRFHCNRSSLHLSFNETKKLQENFLYQLAKLD